MSVSDGQKVNAAVSNAAFMSREVDTSTVGEVDLNSPSAASGTNITNSQREHNSIASFVGKAVNTAKNLLPTWASNLIGVSTDTVFARTEAIQSVVEGLQVSPSTDEAIPRFDGVSGSLQGSGVTISDTDDLTIPGDLTVNGTTTTVNTSTLDVTDANVTVNNGGTQATADAADSGFTVEMSDATDATVGYDSTKASKFICGEVGSLKEIVTVSDTQVITEKDIDFGTASNARRIALPKDSTTNLDLLTDKEALFAYDTTLNEPVFNDGTGWNQIVGTGGAGGINFIKNPDFESGVTDWATYDDTGEGSPDDSVPGNGTGSPSVNLTIGPHLTAATVIRGSASAIITKAATSQQGKGVSTDIAIDNADNDGKTLYVTFEYATQAVTNVYTSGDLACFVYDIDNATLLGRVSNDDNGDLLQTGGTASVRKFAGSFQSTDSANYRIIFHVASTSTNAWSVIIDNVSVSPDVLVPGAIITDWQSYTPTYTGFGSPTNGDLEFKRDGEDYLIRGTFTTGTNTATEARISLPNSKTSKSTIETLEMAGVCGRSTNVASSYYTAIEPSVGYFVFAQQSSTANTGTKLQGTDFANSEVIRVEVRVPIDGLTSGALLSTTETIFQSTKTLGSQSTASHTTSGSFQSISYTEDIDQGNNFDGTTFTAPAAGHYQIQATVAFAANATGIRSVQALKNGTTQLIGDQIINTGASDVAIVNYNQLVQLEKGDTIVIQGNQTSGGTLAYSTTFGKVSFNRVPDFSTFSVFGETEYLETLITSKPVTTAANTWEPVSGTTETITLSPGTWEIGYDVALQLNNAAASEATRAGSIRIYDGTGIVSGSARSINAYIGVSNVVVFSVSNKVETTITSNTTYNLQILNAQAAASSTTELQDSDLDPASPGNDSSSRLWARRIS